ncbi:MAG TPA: hypothetical protein VLG72_00195 [Nitrospirota bacterium]|nr:hypothetical protein [Nitrospirota bacterium]
MEGKIIKELQGHAEVDGHDIGSNEMNIFITASDLKLVIERCIPIINNLGLLNMFSSGYRKLNSESYIRIWPEGDKSEFEIM